MSRRRKSKGKVQKPKPAVAERPAQGVYVEELVDASSGHAKRLRRIDEHPLTLAYERGRLNWPGAHRSADRFAAGSRFRDRFQTIFRSGKDSTDMGVGGGSTEPFAVTQELAGRDVDKVRCALKAKDYLIIERFCGEGWSMADALKAAQVHSHANGVTARVCEALDELVDYYERGTQRRMARQVA